MSDTPAPAVSARGLVVSGPWGPVYGPVDLDIDEGGVTVLVCPAGTGRTALLMTLAGRMRPQRGTLSVFGRTDPRRIFDVAAIAGIDELDQVAESVTVRDALTEQLRWNAPWYRFVRRAGATDLHAVCTPVFGDLPLPPLTEYVEELTELDRLLLRIALANTARPPLLVVGNLDYVTSDRNRELLLQRLIELGRTQTVVTATVNGVPTDAVRAQLAVENTSRAELVRGQKGE
jgi:predicted ABC-type transport system involved in lysophospholipase L1 biosynthesis ATPase subunit